MNAQAWTSVASLAVLILILILAVGRPARRSANRKTSQTE